MNYEDAELKALMQAVNSVCFVNNKSYSDKLASVAGVQLTEELKRFRFAEQLHDELTDLVMADREVFSKVCPPLGEKWGAICDNVELAVNIRQAIESAFRFGYYYAMQTSGESWQPAESVKVTGDSMEIVPPKN